MDLVGKSLSDEEAVGAVLGGEVRAFDGLVERYFGMVYTIAYGRIGRHEAAEDVAQEAFLRAYLHLGTLAPAGRFAAWISCIARNLASNWVRDEGRRLRLAAMIPLDDVIAAASNGGPQPSLGQGPGRKMEMEEENRIVREAVFRLPPAQREMVLLRFAEDLNDRQIAERLGVHPSTVGRQIRRALSAMRAPLEAALRGWARSVRPSRSSVARTSLLVAGASALSPTAKSALAAACAEAAASAAGAGLGEAESSVLALLTAWLSRGAVELLRWLGRAGAVVLAPTISNVALIAVIGILCAGSIALYKVATPRRGVPARTARPSPLLTTQEVADVAKAFADYQEICRKRDLTAALQAWDFQGTARLRGVEASVVESWLTDFFQASRPEPASVAGVSLESVSVVTTHLGGLRCVSVCGRDPSWIVKCLLTRTPSGWKLVQTRMIPNRGDLPAKGGDAQKARETLSRYREACRRGDVATMLDAFDLDVLAASWRMSRPAYGEGLGAALADLLRSGAFDRFVSGGPIESVLRSADNAQTLIARSGQWEWQLDAAPDGWKIVRQERMVWVTPRASSPVTPAGD